MDKRLEKIRHFQASVKDFESYINDRIKQTKSENGKKVNESAESFFETELKDILFKLFGRNTAIEFVEQYPMDPQDRPSFDKRPFVNMVYDFEMILADEQVHAQLYISDVDNIAKYASFSFNDFSFDPITGETSDNDIIREIDYFDSIPPAKLKSKCISVIKKYINKREEDRGYTKIYRQKNGMYKTAFESVENMQTYQEYGLTPTENIPEECLNYIVANIDDFGLRYSVALKKTETSRCTLRLADRELFEEIYELANEWATENDMMECVPDDIEEIFG
jgi:hypothetical protein